MFLQVAVGLYLGAGIYKFVSAGPSNGTDKYSLIDFALGLPMCLALGGLWVIIDTVDYTGFKK